MDSKIGQTQLNYSCTTGVASVNIYTGRLLFEHQDLSIGVGDYQIGVSHIYNSHIASNSYFGRGWKLNIEHILIKNYDKDEYEYTDSYGYRHIFKWYDADIEGRNKYYDTSGLGLLLTEYTDKNIITDEVENQMIFNLENRLEKIISNLKIT